mgnify:CR=1 FL=1
MTFLLVFQLEKAFKVCPGNLKSVNDIIRIGDLQHSYFMITDVQRSLDQFTSFDTRLNLLVKIIHKNLQLNTSLTQNLHI